MLRTIKIFQQYKKWFYQVLIILVIIALQQFPTIVEKYYTHYFFATISNCVRAITKLFPFSLGDIFYAVVVLFILYAFFLFFKKKKEEKFIVRLKHFFLNALHKILWVFILFKLCWGLNYYRLGIAHELKMNNSEYTKEDVEELVCTLIDSVNIYRKKISVAALPQPNINYILQQSCNLYDTKKQQYSFLNYQHKKVKKSLYTSISHYVGFTGYYNPFSGEAQISTDVPMVTLPFTTCHEIAHQLGYASEEEANFVSYLVASNSKDAYFKYSAYLELYRYAAIELMMMDSKAKHGWELDSLVKKDLIDIRKFFQKKANKVAPVMSQMYSQYLKANKQVKGIDSYNEVVGLLVAYKKKYGKI